jgi:exosortase K
MISKTQLITIIKYLIAILVLLFLVLLKISYTHLDNSYLLWLLAPTVFLVELFTGLYFIFINDTGYMSMSGNIIINGTCSGINLFIMTGFISLYFSLKNDLKLSGYIIKIFAYIVFAYIFTIIANSFRISFSIKFEPVISNIKFLSNTDYFVHQTIGIFFFTLFLLFFYLILKWSDQWMKKNLFLN